MQISFLRRPGGAMCENTINKNSSSADYPIRECPECGSKKFTVAELTKEEVESQKDLETRRLLQCENCKMLFLF